MSTRNQDRRRAAKAARKARRPMTGWATVKTSDGVVHPVSPALASRLKAAALADIAARAEEAR